MKAMLMLIIFISMISISSISATSLNQEEHYIVLDKPVRSIPKVVEFFSFLCPYCYQFESIYHVSTIVNKDLPKNVKVIRYHVSLVGGSLGRALTQAWSVAIALGVEDKMITPIFDGIFQTKTIHSPNEIRKIFIDNGINGKDYDAVWNSFMVKFLVFKQEKAVDAVQLHGIPSIVVAGKYLIRQDSMNPQPDSIYSYSQLYANLVKFLIKQS
ncbi:MAG: DsbA family protein [Candidatus Dasytiphilus stammeri]